MADITVEQKKGAQHTWIWATLAILSVVGLMFWLATQDVEETGPVAVEGDTAAAGAGAAGGEVVELAALAGDPAGFVGRPVRIRGATVAAQVGPRAFWADVPGQNPFLVVLGPEIANPGVAQAGQALDLQGTVAEVTPEVLDRWIQEGAIPETAREEAGFATHFLQAARATPGQTAQGQ